MQRDFEREIIPMARAEGEQWCSTTICALVLGLRRMAGLALAPWNVLAGGRLRTDEEEEQRRQTGEKGQ